mmetsp:Transcript_10644/g.16060  ORF Transcript_10644/g.16060 Transcript_10644/m.16060 type:complete len:219 (-) Transcript_10644:402-1058(-)
MNIIVNDLSSSIHLLQTQTLTPNNIEYDTSSLIHRSIQQRTRNRRNSRILRRSLPRPRPNPHQRRTSILHHTPNIGKIHINQSRPDNNLRNPHHTLPQNIIRHPKTRLQRSILRNNIQQLIIRHNNHRIHMLSQPINRFRRLSHPPPPFECKWFRHNGHCQRTTLLTNLGDYRSSTTPSPTTHTTCNKTQVCPLHHGINLLPTLFGSQTSHFGITTST